MTKGNQGFHFLGDSRLSLSGGFETFKGIGSAAIAKRIKTVSRNPN